MKTIAVAGLIGSGKSAFARMLRDELSGYLFDCDSVCAEIIRKDDMKDVFGFSLAIDILQEKKRFISDYIFGNAALREKYEQYIWSKCADEFKSALKTERKRGRNVIILDAPLLFQAGFERHADKVVLVEADREMRRRRFIARGGCESDFDTRDELQRAFFSANGERIGHRVWRTVENNSDNIGTLKDAARAIASELKPHTLSSV